MGGGTGGGLGSFLISKLREEYPDRGMMTFSVTPSSKVSNWPLEAYNHVFAENILIENTDNTILLDNSALHNICKR